MQESCAKTSCLQNVGKMINAGGCENLPRTLRRSVTSESAGVSASRQGGVADLVALPHHVAFPAAKDGLDVAAA